MHGDQRSHSSRPYYWGAIYINDVNCQEGFDIDFRHGTGPVFSTASHVAVVVTHAGTVDDDEEADVALDVWVRGQRADELPYEAVLEVPSGRLSIGDADGEDLVALRPGRWLLQFAVDDAEEARHVEMVLSPL